MRINHLTKLSSVILIFLFGCIFDVAANSAWGSCRIQNISLKKEGNFTKVCVYADKPFEFLHSTEEAKDGKPYRVIIDCKDAVFGLPQHNYKNGLPPGTIKSIRTSQYQAVPERIVRVVLDLKSPVVYKVTEPETQYEANIAILTTQDPDFPMWVAVLEEEKDQKISMKRKLTKAVAAEVGPKRELKSDQSQAFLPGAEGPTDLAVSADREAETVQKGRVYRRTVCYADTGETARSVEEEHVLSSEAQSEVEDASTKKRVSQIIQQKPALPLTEVSSGQTMEQIPSSSYQKEAKRIEEDKTQKDVSSASTKLALKSESETTRVKERETLSAALSDKKPRLSERSSPKRQISPSPVPLGPFPEEMFSPTGTGKKEDASSETPSLIQKGIDKILGPESVTARETKALAESLMIIQSPRESELSLAPQRKMICYNPGTRRDPFLPLTERQDMSFGVAPPPLFENLKLVGILKDEEGNRALLEDEVGFGYILMSGDRIKNGYVISVEDDRAIFHVEEYGGYQIMVLELNREY